ncbi:hypothetical protein [Pseudoalteromonas luteoviolacea]|nr:hypothetical protein [Pseudoalteromonas luteoviolacea]
MLKSKQQSESESQTESLIENKLNFLVDFKSEAVNMALHFAATLR